MWAHLVGYLSLEKRNDEKQVVTQEDELSEKKLLIYPPASEASRGVY